MDSERVNGKRTSDGEAAAAIRDGIRTAILQGEYAPRQRLVEAELAERFEGSRFLVRIALQDLAAQGLIEFQRNKGARVRDVGLDEAIKITQIRQLLDGFVAARAAERVNRQQAATLRQFVKELRAATAAEDPLRYRETSHKLHGLLREIADHDLAERILLQLRDLTVRHQFTLTLVPGRLSVMLPHHEAIVAAVVSQDPASAEAAMRAYLQSTLDALQALAGAAQPLPRQPLRLPARSP